MSQINRLVFTSCLVAIFVGSVALPSWASDGEIGIFADADATMPYLDLPCGQAATLWVYALLQGQSASGITGAEYKVEVTGAGGFSFFESYDPSAASVIGNAFPRYPLNDGLNIAWSNCQAGDGAKVLIGQVTVANFYCSEGETRLRVVKHDDPSNWVYQCPLVTKCDIPVFSRICLGEVTTGLCQGPFPPFPTETCFFSSSGEFVLNPETAVSVVPNDGALHGLSMAAPNPFRDVSLIRYSLPERSVVRLTVYDMSGRAVQTLESGIRDTGHHEVRWSAMALPAGVYFYRLQAGLIDQTQRAVVMK